MVDATTVPGARIWRESNERYLTWRWCLVGDYEHKRTSGQIHGGCATRAEAEAAAREALGMGRR